MMGVQLIPRRGPNWLARKLFWVTPPKASELSRHEDIGDGEYVMMITRRSLEKATKGKDALSCEAMKIAPKSGKQGTNWTEFVTVNRITELEGQLNQLEAVIHRMRCHEWHLDGIIARQDAELKQLRKKED